MIKKKEKKKKAYLHSTVQNLNSIDVFYVFFVLKSFVLFGLWVKLYPYVIFFCFITINHLDSLVKLYQSKKHWCLSWSRDQTHICSPILHQNIFTLWQVGDLHIFQILIFIWKITFLQLALPKMTLDFVDFWKSISQMLRFHLTVVYLLVFPVNIVVHERGAWLSLTLKEHYEFSSRRQRASSGMQCGCLHFSTWSIERI